jgi:hypothetical protein
MILSLDTKRGYFPTTHFLSTLALILFFPLQSSAQTWTRKSNGLFGGDVTSIVSKGNLLFAGTMDAGVFISSDNGMNWGQINNGFTNKYISSLVVKGDTIFAGSFFGGVFTSTNNGATWQSMNTGIGNSQVTSLFLGANRLFASTVNGIYVTSDFKSWGPINNGLPASFFGQFAWVNTISSNGNITIAGLFFQGAYISNNNGNTWNAVLAIPSDAHVTSIIFHDNLIFIGASTGLYVSADGGVNWATIGTGLLPNYLINSLAFQGTKMYACTALGIYQSINNGSTWSLITIAGLNSYQSNSNTILVNDKDLFVGTYSNGILHSVDGGNSWDIRNTNLTALKVDQVVSQKNYLFASTPNGLYRSSNNTNLWERVNPPNSFANLTNPHVKGDTLLTSYFNQVYFSTNFGSSWNSFSSNGFSNSAPQIIYSHKGDIYASTQTGLSVFRSQGNSWTTAINKSGNQYEYFCCMTSVRDTLFAGTWSGNVYVSPDNGSTWQTQNNGLPTGGSVRSLSSSKNRVVAAVDAIYFTDNKGVIWTQANVGTTLTFQALYSSPDNLFGGNFALGAYFSPDNGSSWMNITSDYTSTVGFLSFTSSDTTLYAGTTEGVWAASLPQFSPKIFAFAPTFGVVGTSVTIYGKNFSSIPNQNAVTINGVKASVLVANATSLIIQVPQGASTGPIAINVNGKTIKSITNFCIATSLPTVTFSYSPSAIPTLSSSSATGNQWLFNGNEILGATSQNYTPLESGIYSVKVIFGSCEIKSNDFEYIVTGLESTNQDKTAIAYPVPFKNELNLNLQGFQQNYPIEALLIDSKGSTLSSWVMKSDEIFNIDTQNFPSGIYVIRINQNTKTYSIRAVKQ